MSLIHLPLEAWLDNVALGALSSQETVQTSYDIARLAIERGVPGDFVECGVYGGAQCAAMARAILDEATDDEPNMWTPGFVTGGHVKRVHLFDSFTGVPAAGPHDEGWSHPEGVSLCGLEACKDHMREWGIPDELLVWHPGQFDVTVPMMTGPDTGFPEEHGRFITVRQIAILRLDGDLYESTKVCLEHLYPLLSPGGWVIVDDFALPGCRKAVLEAVSPAPIYFQKGTA